jgi:hypothetical protein
MMIRASLCPGRLGIARNPYFRELDFYYIILGKYLCQGKEMSENTDKSRFPSEVLNTNHSEGISGIFCITLA